MFPARGLYRVTGVFEARSGATLILVKHDVVPGFMDEMLSMAIFAESPVLLTGGMAQDQGLLAALREQAQERNHRHARGVQVHVPHQHGRRCRT